MAHNTSRRGDAPRRSLHLGIDVPLLLVVITLLIFGLLMVYSASVDYSIMVLGQGPYYMFSRQVLWMVVSVTAAVILTFFRYDRYVRLAVLALAGTLVLLVSVLLVSEVINNAARTLLSGSIQPSELAKLVTILYLGVWLNAKKDQLSNISFGFIPLSIILGLLGGLIFLQPDISATLTIFMIGGTLFFLAGVDLRQFLILMLLALVMGFVVIKVSATGQARINDYFISLQDMTNAPYHLSRSLEAMVKGGWFGVGIGLANTKLTGLPVPPTDSIFAVVGEETGVLGASFLVILYLLFLWRGLLIAHRAPDGLGRLLAAGLTIWIVMEAMINIAVTVGLVPMAGNALPFISAGGSNLLVVMAGVGILMNIARMSEKAREDGEKSFDAVIDLRRRDRRGSVSSPRRPASIIQP